MDDTLFSTEEFKKSICLAGARARKETLQAGVPVFNWDRVRELNIVEYPSGRKFEIRYVPNQPGDESYEVVRELHETEA